LKHEMEIEVTEDFNPYKKIVQKFGKENRETQIPNPYGASSLREWGNGICLLRKVEYDSGRKTYVMKDRVSLPGTPEFSKFIEDLGGIRRK